MLISCPSCGAGYEVPEHLLAGAGQALRCALCHHEWVVSVPPPVVVTLAPPPAMQAPEPAAVPAPPAPDLPPQPAMPAPGVGYPDMAVRIDDRERIMDEPEPPEEPEAVYSRMAVAIAWALTVLVVVLLGFGAVYWRNQVMAAWPPSQRAYALVGLS